MSRFQILVGFKYRGSKAVKRETVRSEFRATRLARRLCLQPSLVPSIICLQWFAIHLEFQNFAYMSEWCQLRTSIGICVMLLSHTQHDILALLSTMGRGGGGGDGFISVYETDTVLYIRKCQWQLEFLSFACRSRHMYLKGSYFVVVCFLANLWISQPLPP